MIKTVVTGKNQVTIPAALARELNIAVGTELEWEVVEDKYLIVRPVLSRAEQVKRLEGILRPYLLPGEDPITDLIRERMEEDVEEEGF
jgi:AbrB family looped-hinge helix DNA binding protein